MDPETFEQKFAEEWCKRWDECGLEGDCEETLPSTTHYESGDGQVYIDCEEVSDPTFRECLQHTRKATCEEVEEAAQLDDSNGPWIDVCFATSCV